jgi:hypothetical protein
MAAMRIHRLCVFFLFMAWAFPVFCRQDKTSEIGTSLRASEGMNMRGSDAAYPDEEEYSRAARSYQKGFYSEAVASYQIACDNLNAKACTDLGVMYRRGEGVKRNFPHAADLLLRGCNGGNGLGCSNLGLMYWYGQMPKDDHRVVALFQQGCDKGDKNGCRVLGFMYENGQGVTKDPKRAATFYQRAREHQIPFTVKDRLILIETTVNGADAKLIVDSGGTTVLGRRFLPTPPVDPPTETLDSLHGSSAVYPITVVWTLDGRDKQVRAVTGDLNFPNNSDGILGADILETFKSARFDFQTSVLILEDSEVAVGVVRSDVLSTGNAQ